MWNGILLTTLARYPALPATWIIIVISYKVNFKDLPFQPAITLNWTLTSWIELKYCLISTLYLVGLFGIFILLHIDRIGCFDDFLPTRTLCDTCHNEFESYLRLTLDISGAENHRSKLTFVATKLVSEKSSEPSREVRIGRGWNTVLRLLKEVLLFAGVNYDYINRNHSDNFLKTGKNFLIKFETWRCEIRRNEVSECQ